MTSLMLVLLGHTDDVVEELLHAVSVHPSQQILILVLDLLDQVVFPHQVLYRGVVLLEQVLDSFGRTCPQVPKVLSKNPTC